MDVSNANRALEETKTDAIKLGTLSNNISIKAEEIIKILIERNQLVCSIYEAINPHPFYRELRLQQRKDGIEMMCEKRGERFFLDYILSSAQSNVLALSVFLGFSLQQKWNKLDQIFIDDPIRIWTI
jgi:exonuclease SbcC